MAENRINREQTTREKTVRKKAWKRPEVLPSPTPEPGYEFHWVRISTQGQVDATNVSSKLREGWEPVKASDHPEITMVTVENDRFKDNEYVTSGMKLRFYTGFALKIRGQNVGTICILDVKPRIFSEADQAAMRDLVSWAQTEISLTQLSEVQIKLITELDQAQRDAQIDNQTGLWNQGAIKDVLQRAHHRHLLTQKPYSLMMVDIDNFKAVNDTHGHLFGDQVI